jgi:hypothetical protein
LLQNSAGLFDDDPAVPVAFAIRRAMRIAKLAPVISVLSQRQETSENFEPIRGGVLLKGHVREDP